MVDVRRAGRAVRAAAGGRRAPRAGGRGARRARPGGIRRSSSPWSRSLVAVVVADAVTAVGTAGRLPRTGTGSGEVGLSPFTSLHGNLQRSDAGRPADGQRAGRARLPAHRRADDLDTRPGLVGRRPAAGRSPGVHGQLPRHARRRHQRGHHRCRTALKDQFLPIFAGTTAVSGLPGGWNLRPALGTVFRTDPVNPGTYRLGDRPPSRRRPTLRTGHRHRRRAAHRDRRAAGGRSPASPRTSPRAAQRVRQGDALLNDCSPTRPTASATR